jgi:hypothetical protein
MKSKKGRNKTERAVIKHEQDFSNVVDKRYERGEKKTRKKGTGN